MSATTRIVLLGGYGLFGRRLARLLARIAGIEIVIAGRDGQKAVALAAALTGLSGSTARGAMLDLESPDFAERLAELSPAILIHLAGPFQSRDYAVAHCCIAQGAHYIDLADGTAFVTGITALNEAAREAGVFVLSGASSVPALSAAVVDALAENCASVTQIDIGISPGNRTERGLATVRAILGYCGQPLSGPGDEIGWQGVWRHDYARPVGRRSHSPCDVPDRLLFPERYAGRPAVRFGAGLEVEWMHRSMNLMAWMCQRGWVSNWSRYGELLLRMSRWFASLGTDHGGMHVNIHGQDSSGHAMRASWELIAEDNDGPYVPTLAAAALVRKHLTGRLGFRGAMPCVGVLSLDEFAAEWKHLQINTRTSP